jgi:hypothetical protein
MIAMNGSMLIRSWEMLIPASCSAVAIDSEMPNRNAPSSTHTGLPRASMQITIAM